jgi:histidinol-phosphate/aromatic aminotransferase/cobyric acid decarboxylase-like protein
MSLGMIVRPLNDGLGNYLRISVGASDENHKFLISLSKVIAAVRQTNG